MPAGNGTGPQGFGPMTGRRGGFCGLNNNSANRPSGILGGLRGWFSRRFGGGYGTGRGTGYGTGRGRDSSQAGQGRPGQGRNRNF